MDDRRGQAERNEQEEAVFAPTSVGANRSPRLLATGAALAAIVLVTVGVMPRFLPAEAPASVPPPASVAAVAATPAPTVRVRPRPTSGDVVLVPGNPLLSVFRVDLRPAGSHLFVHGDVFAIAVVRVSVTLEGGRGEPIDRRTVEIAGGSTAFQLGATRRFDVHFSVPDEVMGEGVWVSSTAFNDDGRELASFRQSIPVTAEPM